MSVSAVAPLTLLVVDDHPVFLEVLAQALAAERDVKIVATACDATTAVAAWRRHRPAVTLIDLPPLMEPVSINRVSLPMDRPCPLAEA
jgi:DNA-binding NarL/FixJ family response regulator